MTPRTPDWRSVERKLTAIRRLLGQLTEIGPVDEERLRTDLISALAVERILTLVVELAFASNAHISAALLKQAPDTYAESFTLAAEAGMIDVDLARVLLPSAGMRNVLVHAYLDVDHAKVAVAVVAAQKHYGEYVRQAARWLARRAEEDCQE